MTPDRDASAGQLQNELKRPLWWGARPGHTAFKKVQNRQLGGFLV